MASMLAAVLVISASRREPGSTSPVGLVFAGHAPDEGIGTGAGAHMDRPGRRQHCIAIGDDQMTRLAPAVPSGGRRDPRRRGRK